MFDFGIEWLRDVSLPDSEYGDFQRTLIRFRCGCEWFGESHGKWEWRSTLVIASPDCCWGHTECERGDYPATCWDFETEDERLERQNREEEARQAARERYLASEQARNEQKKAAQKPIDGRPMTRDDVLEVVRAGGRAIAADAKSYTALYAQKLVYKKPIMKLQDGFGLYKIRIKR
jgi:hypothetical protein